MCSYIVSEWLEIQPFGDTEIIEFLQRLADQDRSLLELDSDYRGSDPLRLYRPSSVLSASYDQEVLISLLEASVGYRQQDEIIQVLPDEDPKDAADRVEESMCYWE